MDPSALAWRHNGRSLEQWGRAAQPEEANRERVAAPMWRGSPSPRSQGPTTHPPPRSLGWLQGGGSSDHLLALSTASQLLVFDLRAPHLPAAAWRHSSPEDPPCRLAWLPPPLAGALGAAVRRAERWATPAAGSSDGAEPGAGPEPGRRRATGGWAGLAAGGCLGGQGAGFLWESLQHTSELVVEWGGPGDPGRSTVQEHPVGGPGRSTVQEHPVGPSSAEATPGEGSSGGVRYAWRQYGDPAEPYRSGPRARYRAERLPVPLFPDAEADRPLRWAAAEGWVRRWGEAEPGLMAPLGGSAGGRASRACSVGGALEGAEAAPPGLLGWALVGEDWGTRAALAATLLARCAARRAPGSPEPRPRGNRACQGCRVVLPQLPGFTPASSPLCWVCLQARLPGPAVPLALL
jgi:hypothetical protein